MEGFTEKSLYVTGDDIVVQNYLSSRSLEKLKSFTGETKLIVIDEAQKIENIGESLNLLGKLLWIYYIEKTGNPRLLSRLAQKSLTN